MVKLALASVTAIVVFGLVMFSQQMKAPDSSHAFQISTLNSLLVGSYEGRIEARDLLSHGDFGLGAMEYMGGELVCVDASCYQIPIDGKAHKMPDDAKVTFATMVFFQADKTIEIDGQYNFTELQEHLNERYIEQDGMFAIRATGFFSEIDVRSIPKQDKLHVPLSEIVENQTVFHLSDTPGTLVGFYMPQYVGEVNVGGYHFHFLTDDKEAGGHMLNMNITNGTIQIAKISEIRVTP